MIRRASFRRLSRRTLLCPGFLLALLALGCTDSTGFLPCEAATHCPVVDENATAEDVRVAWAGGQDITVTLNGAPSDIGLVGGEVVFTPDPEDPDCEGSCAITLKRMNFLLDPLYLVSSSDSLKVSNLDVSFVAPLSLESPDGAGAVLPAGSETHACAKVKNLLTALPNALVEDGRLTARATTEELTLDARIPLTLYGSSESGCLQFDLELSGVLSGALPFAQNPLRPDPE
jgi:hypothetical protein